MWSWQTVFSVERGAHKIELGIERDLARLENVEKGVDNMEVLYHLQLWEFLLPLRKSRGGQSHLRVGGYQE